MRVNIVEEREELKCLPRLSCPDTKIERSIVDIRQGVGCQLVVNIFCGKSVD